MKAHVKYARARDQLYHLKVKFRQMDDEISRNHRTEELQQTLDMLARVIAEALDAFEHGDVLEVLINRYAPMALPGFEEPMAQMKKAIKYDEP